MSSESNNRPDRRSLPPTERDPRGLTRAQRAFAKVLGQELAERWRQERSDEPHPVDRE